VEEKGSDTILSQHRGRDEGCELKGGVHPSRRLSSPKREGGWL
jgi:hypothetical protein